MTTEIIEAEIHGQVFRKRTRTGQRFIAYAQAEGEHPEVCAFKTAKNAESWGFWMRDHYDCLAHGWAEAKVVA